MNIVENIFEKYNELNKLEEVYFVPPTKVADQFYGAGNFIRHYYKHVLSDEDGIYKLDYLTPKEYNDLADELSTADFEQIKTGDNGELLNKSGVIGYKTNNGKMGKYNLDNNLLVVYGPDFLVTLYKMPLPKFIRKVLNSDGPYGYGGPLN
jgi:hypothetical protein